MQFETKLGRNIHRTICALKSRHIERNELFVSGRMAYVIDLEEESDTDIPTTLIRSKVDIPALDSTPTLTTNDIVINKLAQILTYLRQGNRHKNKKGKKDKGILLRPDNERPNIDDSIYGDIGDYVPSTSSSRDKDRRDKDRRDNEIERDERGKHNYFEKSSSEQNEKATSNAPQVSSRSAKLLSRLAQEPEGYAECYPGLDEMQDAIDDSDDEVDYTKMDLGNKKGPVGRWDFDTQEEYSDYMNNKEALPKAAFQYGVKMADGRRTRKHKDKNEKAVLDREWQQIQNIIQKRKGPKDDGPEFKVPRY